jgi:hypothetical protein
MAIMMAQKTDAARGTGRATERPAGSRAGSSGAMALQSGRSSEAMPQAFVRLTGAPLAKPRAGSHPITE